MNLEKSKFNSGIKDDPNRISYINLIVAIVAAVISGVVAVVSFPDLLRKFFAETDPRVLLKNEGIMWSEASFLDAFVAKDGRVLSLFFDGGWRVTKWQFVNLLTTSYYPEIGKHFSEKNLQDKDDTCPIPKMYQAPKTGTKHILTEKWASSSNLGSASAYFDTPKLYEVVKKYNDKDRDVVLRKICNRRDVVEKIDIITSTLNVIHPKWVDQYDVDAEINRWRLARKFLTNENTKW